MIKRLAPVNLVNFDIDHAIARLQKLKSMHGKSYDKLYLIGD